MSAIHHLHEVAQRQRASDSRLRELIRQKIRLADLNWEFTVLLQQVLPCPCTHSTPAAGSSSQYDWLAIFVVRTKLFDGEIGATIDVTALLIAVRIATPPPRYIQRTNTVGRQQDAQYRYKKEWL